MGFFALAQIAPFAAIRYTQEAGKLSELFCPPYHAIPPGGQALLYGISPYNAVRLELPMGGGPYAEAADTLNVWLHSGILRRDETPAFYGYRRAFESCKGNPVCIDGLFARVDVPGGNPSVPPRIFDPIAEDRRRMVEAMRCQASPVVCLYEDWNRTIVSRLAPCFETEPLVSFMLYHVTHTLWRIDDPVWIEAVQIDFARKELTVADPYLCGAASAFGSYLALLADSAALPPSAAHKFQPLTGLVMYGFR
jgi:uncharacterized protein (DUF1015 family)